MSGSNVEKGIKDTIRDFIYIDLFPPRTGSDVVSSNSKVVLYGLFALLGFAVLTYAITIVGGHYTATTKEIVVKVNKNNITKTLPLNATEKLDQLDQLGQVNGVYIAAISGALALGGTLIAQLWGKG